MGQEELLKPPQYLKSINYKDPQVIAVLIGLFIILTTTVLFLIWRRKKHARRGVLLMGLSDSGKTLIYSRLLHDMYVQTHTSVKENTGDYYGNGGSLKIIDIPGHERLRGKFFDDYKGLARGIVYVVDSSTFQKEIRDVAEFLYTLLSDAVVSKNCPPFLILCNKQDQTMSKGCNVIKSLLEKEMNVLRTTKSSQLESTNDTANNNTFLGKQDKEFEFEHVYPIKVDFAESAALMGDEEKSADLESLEKWLAEIA
ncbi:hypothetical protein C0J52_23115 [Blattella germanica]|nr:hypothetical protein C0J52_23115 [Blattella germanica]